MFLEFLREASNCASCFFILFYFRFGFYYRFCSDVEFLVVLLVSVNVDSRLSMESNTYYELLRGGKTVIEKEKKWKR